MWCRQDELLPVKKAFRFPCFLTSSSSFLSKLGKKLFIFMIIYLLAYEAPAASNCFDTIVLGNKLHGGFISENQSNVPCLVLLRIDRGGDDCTVMIFKPISLRTGN